MSSQRKRSLWLIATAALLAFAAVVVTLLVVLDYDRGGAEPIRTATNETGVAQQSIRPQRIPVDEPASEDSVVDESDVTEAALDPEVDSPVDEAPGWTEVPVETPLVGDDTVVERTEVVEEEAHPLDEPPSVLAVPPFEPGARLAVQDLLAISASSEVQLGLLGGESVLGNREVFEMKEEALDDFRTAWVVHHAGRSGPRVPVARFGVSQDYLHFFWHPDCGVQRADLLRNCLLAIAIDDRQAALPMRDAGRGAAVPIGGPNSYGRQTLVVDSLPDPAVLRLEVIRADGPAPFATEFAGRTAAAGESLSVDLGAEADRLPLVVQMSLTAARGGARKMLVNYVVQYQNAAGERLSLERPSVQRDLRIMEQQRRDAIGEAALEKVERRIRFYEALDKLTRLEEGVIRLHYRIYADVGGKRVDLWLADQDAR